METSNEEKKRLLSDQVERAHAIVQTWHGWKLDLASEVRSSIPTRVPEQAHGKTEHNRSSRTRCD